MVLYAAHLTTQLQPNIDLYKDFVALLTTIMQFFDQFNLNQPAHQDISQNCSMK